MEIYWYGTGTIPYLRVKVFSVFMALTIGVFSRGLQAAAFKNLSETIKKEISVFFKNMKPCFSKLVNGGSRNNIDPSSGIYRSCFSVKSVTLVILLIANNSLQILRLSPFFRK
jgi:hypothetical protein